MILIPMISASTLPYSKYFGAAFRAYTLSCRSLVFHSDRLRVLDIHLFTTLHTVCLH